MGMTETEKTHVSAKGFDLRSPYEALDILVTAQMSAAWSVRSALRDIARGSELMADAVAGGGKLAYAAAGSSALMALADGLELPGTYGIPKERIKILIAGGLASLTDLTGATEDDELQAARDVAEAGIGAGGRDDRGFSQRHDALRPRRSFRRVCRWGQSHRHRQQPGHQAAARSGRRDLPADAARGHCRLDPHGRRHGAEDNAQHDVDADGDPAQDTSTTAYMVNLFADNLKLKGRARRIVAAIAEIDEDEAAHWLEQAGGSVKAAVLLASGAGSPAAARHLLESTHDRLRPALSILRASASSAQRNAS